MLALVVKTTKPKAYISPEMKLEVVENVIR